MNISLFEYNKVEQLRQSASVPASCVYLHQSLNTFQKEAHAKTRLSDALVNVLIHHPSRISSSSSPPTWIKVTFPTIILSVLDGRKKPWIGRIFI
jgi:hypothetical protein